MSGKLISPIIEVNGSEVSIGGENTFWSSGVFEVPQVGVRAGLGVTQGNSWLGVVSTSMWQPRKSGLQWDTAMKGSSFTC